MQKYSRTAIILHWVIALALAFQVSLGWSLDALGSRGFALFQLHKSIGISILVLTLARVFVRLTKPRPAPAGGGWGGALAKIVHVGLYGFMILAPLTGWALVSTAKVKIPTLIFGTIPLPHLPLPIAANDVADRGHGLLALIGMALLALHVAGALRHHLLLRDGLIWRMVPGRSVAVMLALIALVPLGFAAGKLVARAGPASAANPAPKENAQEAPVKAAADNALVVTAASSDADNASVVENAIATVPAAAPPTWTVQPGGKLGFTVGNSGYSINGGFSRWTADIMMDPDRPETADIRVEVDLASASVGDPTQDAMLPGDEFFGVAAHPRAVFTAKGATATRANSYTAKGKLTLKGVTAPQSIKFTLKGTGLKRQVSGNASIARKTFDVGNGDSSGGLDSSVALDFSFAATGKQP
ncbi:polyisoprenoid-binding protein [Sphingobium sp. SCG-1]|uniref:cytochrome b/b6 domain-containing protein n=1 Tax=Sphingobium sp. SCG-1 TaxID=2072936 RepID=UPI000CD6B527|nr:cytochrome b/b6 domain-containing protein [Sphingobium sp. SCG-1]AUW58001.1 polyisoprenoid-binding protein [Sphingobium sp. SCG-1]